MLDNIVLKADNICKTYIDDNNNSINILNGVNLCINKSEIVVVVGSSGSGKSTLLHILGLLDVPSSGSVIIQGLNTVNLSEKQKSILRNVNLGFIYQFHHLLPDLSVLDNVSMPLIIRRNSFIQARYEAKIILDLVGLSDKENRMPYTLSGGERQRVAIARSMVTKPDCVLADEPTGSLDKVNAYKMFDLFTQLRSNFGSSFLIATHDSDLISIADRKLILEHGTLLEY
ncbi:lipoprotein-releasing system ATP-binding protein [Candidatus Kinetoplastibacterium desouzaii TCC079E]|uniref:Lipoprotein-releasing system ATP-binding protein n=1 Tax=Candidatus Kinetoplastidibacterium desouzai TCC079E TaxID=1208919 RepID=M1L287_9PROT|nr:ATP-binding cassette domain-containing protein [Candidatus Kinetoplastibacterium desouzaii]AGF46863.1 lipoprotein-releasing system ATP-binding protein [Candidatus Kinetoplastibacterium desouzaii TCC079E]